MFEGFTLESVDGRTASTTTRTGAAGRRITCPTMLLESARDDLDIHGDPAAIWTPWLEHPLTHRVIDSAHHQAEEAPDQVAAALLEFLG